MLRKTDDSSDDELYVGSIGQFNVNTLTDPEWTQNVEVEGRDITFQLDTGAVCNVISCTLVKLVNKMSNLKATSIPLRSYSGHKITPRGVVTLKCKLKGQMYDQVFHVVNDDVTPILGAQACKEMGLVERIYRVVSSPTNKLYENIPEDIMKEYGPLFKGIGCMPGHHSIQVDPSVKPVVHPPRKVPLALKSKVKTELDRMESEGIVIKQTEPTPWVNSMVSVAKSNGKVRLCIDPRDLNVAIQREHFPMKTIEDVLAELPDAKVFSKLDATSGFWQLRLDAESTKLCTFNSPFGRYSFTRLPFGIKSAPEVYQRAVSEMISGLEGCEAIVDDILIWGTDLQEHDARLRKVLDRVKDYNLRLSPEKCRFRQNQVTYVGHVLSDEGAKPDDEKIRAVRDMEPPTCKKELQTFLGFVQYLGKFVPNLSEVSAPLRELLQKTTEWYWDVAQENSFRRLKQLVTQAPVLRYYDPAKELTLTVDASSKGLGAAIVQDGQPIAYASRAMTTAQQNYAQIEKEALAIAFGCTRFHQFVYGRNVTVESDHKPLQSIFRKPLMLAPPRLQRILLTLQRYDLNVMYKPGKEMFLADHLSRAYLPESTEDIVPDLTINSLLTSYLPVSPEMYRKLQGETSKDRELQTLQDVVLEGWPDTKEEIVTEILPYWNFRDEISCVDGLLYKNHKLIIPKAMRPEMLKIVHKSHLGIVKSKSLARDILHWPGMATDIENTIKRCTVCAETPRGNPKEPLVVTELPDRPWSVISADLFEFRGNHYLVSVDNYSKWPELAKLDNLSSSNTISYLKGQMSRYGIPDRVQTDNGPQFACDEFKRFSSEYGFEHVTSSPRFPQSNGQAERTVQTVKNLIRKAEDPFRALLDYRNTPIDGLEMSPAQMFLGRRLKTDLPTTTPLLEQTKTNKAELKLRMQTLQVKAKHNYDKHAGRELKPLHEGDKVLIQNENKWIPGEIQNKHASPRSYVVKANNGRRYRRNRRHIRPTSANFEKPLSVKLPELPDTPSDDPPSNLETQEPDVVPVAPQQELEEPPGVTSPLRTQKTTEPVVTRSGREVRAPSRFKDFD